MCWPGGPSESTVDRDPMTQPTQEDPPDARREVSPASPSLEHLSTRDARLVRTLFDLGSTIIRVDDEIALFDFACSALAGMDEVTVAWAGLVEPVGDRLHDMAISARDPQTHNLVRMFARDPAQRQALLRGLRQTGAFFVEVVESADPQREIQPWFQLARELAVGSIGFLPIVHERLMLGALVLATESKDFFEEPRRSLLVRLAGDIAAKVDFMSRRHGQLETERLAEEVSTRLHALFESAPIAIAVDQEPHLEVNLAFIEMFGSDPGPRATFESLARFFEPEAFDEMRHLHQRRSLGRAAPARYDTVGIRADGSRIPVLVQIGTLQTESGPRAVIFLTDMSLDV